MLQREDLEPAGVSEHRAFPTHKAMDAAHAPKDFRSRSQKKVISIRKQDLRTRILKRLRELSLYGRLRAHGHKERRLHFIVQSAKRRSSGARTGGLRLEMEMKPGWIHVQTRIVIKKMSE